MDKNVKQAEDGDDTFAAAASHNQELNEPEDRHLSDAQKQKKQRKKDQKDKRKKKAKADDDKENDEDQFLDSILAKD